MSRTLICRFLFVLGAFGLNAGSAFTAPPSKIPSEETPPPITSKYPAVKQKAGFYAKALQSIDTWVVDYMISVEYERLRPDVKGLLRPRGGVLIVAVVALEAPKGMGEPRHKKLVSMSVGAVGATEDEAWAKFQESTIREGPGVGRGEPAKGVFEHLRPGDEVVEVKRWFLMTEDFPKPKPNPDELRRVKADLERVVANEHEKHAKEAERMARELGILREEKDKLADTLSELREARQVNREALAVASKAAEGLEKELLASERRLTQAAKSLGDCEDRLRDLDAANGAFLATFKRHVEADVKNGAAGWNYEFAGDFVPNGNFGQLNREMYDRVFAYLAKHGEFPTVSTIAPKNGVTPLTKADFEAYNARARERRGLPGEIAQAQKVRANAQTSRDETASKYRAALSLIGQHERARTALSERGAEANKRRLRLEKAEGLLKEGEEDNRIRKEFIELAEQALQSPSAQSKKGEKGMSNPFAKGDGKSEPLPRNPFTKPSKPE